MSKAIKERCCPHCKSTTGFIDSSITYVYIGFNFYGEQIECNYFSDYLKQLKRKHCIDCGKTIPKKMIKEIFGE